MLNDVRKCKSTQLLCLSQLKADSTNLFLILVCLQSCTETTWCLANWTIRTNMSLFWVAPSALSFCFRLHLESFFEVPDTTSTTAPPHALGSGAPLCFAAAATSCSQEGSLSLYGKHLQLLLRLHLQLLLLLCLLLALDAPEAASF